MAGEKILLLLLFILHLFNLSDCSEDQTVFIRGGILFEKIRETPVTINPPTIIYHRQLNFSDLQHSLVKAKIFSKAYARFCDGLNTKLTENIKLKETTKFFISESKLAVTNAKTFCENSNARLPEIQNEADFKELYNIVVPNSIQYVTAGIIPDVYNFAMRFISNNDKAISMKKYFRRIFYYHDNKYTHKACSDKPDGGYNEVDCLNKLKNSPGIAYVMHNDTLQWDLVILDNRFHNIRSRIVCQTKTQTKEEERQANLLLRMAAHSCKRDKLNVMQTTDLIVEEAVRFTNIKIEDVEKAAEQHKFRTKRDSLSSPDTEYDLFKNATFTADIFCKFNDRPEYTTRCDKFQKFLEILENNTKIMSKMTKIPETMLLTKIATSHLKLAKTLEPGDFNPCVINSLSSQIDSNYVNDDLSRLIDYSNTKIEDCNKWHNDYNYEAYRRRMFSNELRPFVKEILEKFYDLDFTQKISPEGRDLTDLNHRMEKLIEAHYIVKQASEPFEALASVENNTNTVFYGVFNGSDVIVNDSPIFSNESFESAHQSDLGPMEFREGQPFYEFSGKRKRVKRIAPMILAMGGAGLIGTITDISSGREPLSFLGTALSSITGLVHKSQLQPHIEMIEKHTKALDQLAINQNELETAYNSLANSITLMDEFSRSLEYSTATMFQEFDHKLNLQTITSAIQATILKTANIITNAKTHVTSPYILSKQELALLALQQRANKVYMSGDLNDAYTTSFLTNTKYLFSIRLPVLEDKNLFEIYRAKPIPIFAQDNVYKARTDVQYIAYSSSDRKYSILTEEEFQLCSVFKYCKTVDVERPISENSHCVMKTLDTGKQACPLITYHEKEPFYYIYGSKLIYSVKGPELTNLNCKINEVHERSSVYLEGMGTAKVSPGCTITFQNGMKATINPEPVANDLGQVKFMNLLKYTPDEHDFKFEVVYNNVSNVDLHVPNITKVDTDMFQQILQEIINPSQVIPEVIRAFTGIAIAIVILFIICKCSPKFAIWFKTCIFWKNPKTWWVDFQQYDIRTFEKFRQHQETTTNWFKRHVANMAHNNRKPACLKTPEIDMKPSKPSPLSKFQEEQAKLKERMMLDPRPAESAPEENEPQETQQTVYPTISFVPLPTDYFSNSYQAGEHVDRDTDEVTVHNRPIILNQPSTPMLHATRSTTLKRKNLNSIDRL